MLLYSNIGTFRTFFIIHQYSKYYSPSFVLITVYCILNAQVCLWKKLCEIINKALYNLYFFCYTLMLYILLFWKALSNISVEYTTRNTFCKFIIPVKYSDSLEHSTCIHAHALIPAVISLFIMTFDLGTGCWSRSIPRQNLSWAFLLQLFSCRPSGCQHPLAYQMPSCHGSGKMSSNC